MAVSIVKKNGLKGRRRISGTRRLPESPKFPEKRIGDPSEIFGAVDFLGGRAEVRAWHSTFGIIKDYLLSGLGN